MLNLIKRLTVSILLFIIFLPSTIYAQKFPDMASTPPMGWNSWNHFACDITEDIIKETADAMEASKMDEVGYEYINIDDCWQGKRDENGYIHADPKRFPSGMKALADYIHSKGLKFGIYSCAGIKTCQGYPGSRGYEFQDAKTYASWGVDYLKYDWCYVGTQNPEASYKLMCDALRAAERPVVFAISEFKTGRRWSLDLGQVRRATSDIEPCFSCKYNWGTLGVIQILEEQLKYRVYSGPNHWNDLDMLQVGNEGLTINECRTHFSLWCMAVSPLLAGNDLRNMTPEIEDILTKKAVIEINQDSCGIPALRWIDYGNWEIWFKPLANGEYAYCFLNKSNEPIDINVDLNKTIYDKVFNEDFTKKIWKTYRISDHIYRIKDLWNDKDLGTTKKNLKARIQKHGVLLIKLSKE